MESIPQFIPQFTAVSTYLGTDRANLLTAVEEL
jgi:hypothetical protein